MKTNHLNKLIAVLCTVLIFSFGASAQKLRSDSIKIKTATLSGPTIHVSDEYGYPNNTVIVHVTVDSTGLENSIQFSLNYDASKLSNPVVTRGSAVQQGNFETYFVDNNIGMWTYFPDQQTALPEGTNEIATVQFNVAPDALGDTPINFVDSPYSCYIMDSFGDPMTGTWDSGTLTILGTTAAGVTVEGFVLDESGAAVKRATVSLTDDQGQTVTTQTNQFGSYQFADVTVGHLYLVRVQHPKYYFPISTRAISLLDSMSGVDFYAAAR